MWKNRFKAQSLMEYAVLMVAAAACASAMVAFATRAFQEKFRESADVFGDGEQYEKGVTETINLDTSGVNINSLGYIPMKNKIEGCKSVVFTRDDLLSAINDPESGLLYRADQAEKRAQEMQAAAAQLSSKGLSQQAVEKMNKQAKELRQQAQGWREEAKDKEAEAQDYKERFPECFPG